MTNKKNIVKNLVIVESPAKANTIAKYLGKDFVVKASYGHIRDLPKTKLGVDVKNNFQPEYYVTRNKQTTKALNEIKKLYDKKNTELILATDEDREGEAIGWHLLEILKPPSSKQVKRIVFHEITKDAIAKAIQNPRTINEKLVNAQQARRVLDRLVGYELSPILWKTVKSGLSAGRVQSVALRLIVERDEEIKSFDVDSNFKINASFLNQKEQIFQAELSKKFALENDANLFLEDCKNATFKVSKIVKKQTSKTPAPPFITSTLQQEAARKFGYPVKKTMRLAQKLYETGKITYMRTDSTLLSDFALKEANKIIIAKYGQKYAKTRQYKTKNASAQEAHEAIRPTVFATLNASSDSQEQRLYELIWQRALASQMSNAKFDKTNATINISTRKEKFNAKGEILIFDGFLKVYQETKENGYENVTNALLPSLYEGELLQQKKITARERFKRPPARYSEASLVRKLEEMGIGRPSTYAPTISTILARGYVTLESRPGNERSFTFIVLENNTITKKSSIENTGAEKSKLFPTFIGNIVSNFLVKHFPDIVDYAFTANIEKEFDDISFGKKVWNTMIKDFYENFHKNVLIKKKTVTRKDTMPVKELGKDPKTQKIITAKMGPYGSYVQLGKKEDKEKPKTAKLLPNQQIDTITIDEAIALLQLPRLLGKTEDGEEIFTNIGPYGPYIIIGKTFISIKPLNPFDITIEQALDKIKEKKKADEQKIIKSFTEKNIKILNGKWGPYITNGKKNCKVPKDKIPLELTLEECLELLQKPKKRKKKKTA